MNSFDRYTSSRSRVFRPKILFHEPVQRTEMKYFHHHHFRYYYRNDEYSRWKEQVENMLNRNSRIWMFESNRFIFDNDSSIDATQSLPTSPTLPYYNPRIISQGPQVTDGTFINAAPKRRRGNLPKATTALLKDWLAKHKKHPYPTEEEKQDLAKKTMLNLQQISNWFINARRRHLPHLLNSTNSKSTGSDLDIYPYKAAEKADSDSSDNVKCSRRHSAKACSRIRNGAIKKLH